MLVLVFMIALNCWLTFWNLVGGSYHLELMGWPWKLGLSLALAGLVTRLTADLASEKPQRVWPLLAAIALVMAVAGGATYNAHLNEPANEDDSGDEPQVTKTVFRRPTSVPRSGAADSAVRARH